MQRCLMRQYLYWTRQDFDGTTPVLALIGTVYLFSTPHFQSKIPNSLGETDGRELCDDSPSSVMPF